MHCKLKQLLCITSAPFIGPCGPKYRALVTSNYALLMGPAGPTAVQVTPAMKPAFRFIIATGNTCNFTNLRFYDTLKLPRCLVFSNGNIYLFISMQFSIFHESKGRPEILDLLE